MSASESKKLPASGSSYEPDVGHWRRLVGVSLCNGEHRTAGQFPQGPRISQHDKMDCAQLDSYAADVYNASCNLSSSVWNG